LIENFLYNYQKLSSDLPDNGQKAYGIPSNLIAPLSTIILAKYKEFVSDNDIRSLINT